VSDVPLSIPEGLEPLVIRQVNAVGGLRAVPADGPSAWSRRAFPISEQSRYPDEETSRMGVPLCVAGVDADRIYCTRE
jgi:hypothetical protein